MANCTLGNVVLSKSGTFGIVTLKSNDICQRVILIKDKEILEINTQLKILSRKYRNIMDNKSHPNIVKHYTCELLHSPFVSASFLLDFEYCKLGSLHELITIFKKSEKKFTQYEINHFILDILRGLKFLHGEHLIHGTLSTYNIWMTAQGRLKMSGFGLYKTKLVNQIPMKFLRYFAPEVICMSNYDWESDIWAMGCVIYECCTLSQPFEQTESSLELLSAISSRKYKETNFKELGYEIEVERLINHWIKFCPSLRLSINGSLSHPYIMRYYFKEQFNPSAY